MNPTNQNFQKVLEKTFSNNVGLIIMSRSQKWKRLKYIMEI